MARDGAALQQIRIHGAGAFVETGVIDPYHVSDVGKAADIFEGAFPQNGIAGPVAEERRAAVPEDAVDGIDRCGEEAACGVTGSVDRPLAAGVAGEGGVEDEKVVILRGGIGGKRRGGKEDPAVGVAAALGDEAVGDDMSHPGGCGIGECATVCRGDSPVEVGERAVGKGEGRSSDVGARAGTPCHGVLKGQATDCDMVRADAEKAIRAVMVLQGAIYEIVGAQTVCIH